MTHQCSETGWECLGATPGMVHLEAQLGVFKVIIEVSRRRGVKSMERRRQNHREWRKEVVENDWKRLNLEIYFSQNLLQTNSRWRKCYWEGVGTKPYINHWISYSFHTAPLFQLDLSRFLPFPKNVSIPHVSSFCLFSACFSLYLHFPWWQGTFQVSATLLDTHNCTRSVSDSPSGYLVCGHDTDVTQTANITDQRHTANLLNRNTALIPWRKHPPYSENNKFSKDVSKTTPW